MTRTLTFFLAFAIQVAGATGASPFTFVSKDQNDVRYYSGQASVKGRFVALWEISEFDDRPRPEPYLVVRLRIRKESANVLPALPRGRPLTLGLRNTDKALEMLLPKSLAERIRTHKIQRVEGDAEITITSLEAWVTCDRWGFSAEVAAASTSLHVIARKGQDEISSGGC